MVVVRDLCGVAVLVSHHDGEQAVGLLAHLNRHVPCMHGQPSHRILLKGKLANLQQQQQQQQQQS
jgi:hypothetical protein